MVPPFLNTPRGLPPVGADFQIRLRDWIAANCVVRNRLRSFSWLDMRYVSRAAKMQQKQSVIKTCFEFYRSFSRVYLVPPHGLEPRTY